MKITMKKIGLGVFVLILTVSIPSFGFAQGFQMYPDGTYGSNLGRSNLGTVSQFRDSILNSLSSIAI